MIRNKTQEKLNGHHLEALREKYSAEIHTQKNKLIGEGSQSMKNYCKIMV